MKLLIVADYLSPQYEYGGPVVSIENLLKQLSVYDIEITTANKHQIKSFKRSEIIKFDTIYINTFFGACFRTLLPKLIFVRGIRKIVIAPRGELAQVNIASKRKILKMGYIASVTLLLKFLSFRGVKILFHATSELEASDLPKICDVEVLPNIPRKVRGLKLTRNLEDVNVLANFGRIDRKKNLQFLIDLSGKINGTRVELTGMVSDEKYKQELVVHAKKVGVQLDIYPARPFSEIQARYSNLNTVLIFPSKNENFGHAMVEALQFGIPVFVSPYIPCAKFLDPKFVIEDFEKTRDYIENYFTNPILYQEYSNSNRYNVLKSINSESLIVNYLKLFV